MRIDKREYGRLLHIINSNPKKWKKNKINRQIIDDKDYYFRYNNFNEVDIIKRERIFYYDKGKVRKSFKK